MVMMARLTDEIRSIAYEDDYWETRRGGDEFDGLDFSALKKEPRERRPGRPKVNREEQSRVSRENFLKNQALHQPTVVGGGEDLF